MIDIYEEALSRAASIASKPHCPACHGSRISRWGSNHKQGDRDCRRRAREVDAVRRGLLPMDHERFGRMWTRYLEAPGVDPEWILAPRSGSLPMPWLPAGAVRIMEARRFHDDGRDRGLYPPEVRERWLADLAADPTMSARVTAMSDAEFHAMLGGKS